MWILAVWLNVVEPPVRVGPFPRFYQCNQIARSIERAAAYPLIGAGCIYRRAAP